MNCSTCGTFLAEGVQICPQCGRPTTYYSRDIAGPDDPTAPASSARQSFAVTSYGPDQHVSPPPSPYSYNASDQSSYAQDPYQPISSLSSPPGKGRKGPVIFIIGLVLLLLIIGTGGLMLFNTQRQPAGQTTKGVTPVAISTPNPSENPYLSGMATLAMNDPMQDNSKGYGWAEFRTNLAACQFIAGVYQIDTSINRSESCYPRSGPQFNNFTFEAQIKIVKGDCGAILFRADDISHNFYDFEVCQDGRYEVDSHTGKAGGSFKKLIPLRSSLLIHSGLDQDNLLAVVAIDNTFVFYLNHQKIDSLTDSTYSQGQIGLYASGYYGDPTEVQFSNVKVWTL